MATAEIDRLEIEIDAASSQAVQHIKDLSSALQGMKRSARSATTELGGVAQQLKDVQNTGSSASKSLKIVKAALGAIGFRQVVRFLGDAVTSINDYVENVNLFQVSMGKFYDEAYDYAQLVSDKLGVDPSQWMRTQGVFMSMANGFGMAKDQAYALSEGLTEISYDLMSLYNDKTIEESSLRVQSALAGEIEPIRRLGISISQATLQEYALSKGIKESVANMTEQEKALLRSLKLIEGAKDIGAIGDFAKTLESPANAMRVLNQQITQFKRAIGSVMLPAIIQILPYIQAFVSLLTDLISRLAVLVGFEMPTWDNSAWDSAYDSATGSVEDTTDAVKKLKKETLGIDELNIISPDSGAAAEGLSGWATDLTIPDLWDKTAISEIQTKADEIKEAIKSILPYAIAVGAALLAWKIGPSVMSGLKTLYETLGYIFGRIMMVSPEAAKLASSLKFAGVIAVLTTMVTRFIDLYKNSESFRKGIERIGDIASGAFTVVKDILGGVWTIIKDIGLGIYNLLPEPVKEAIGSGISWIADKVKLLDLDWKDLAITIAGIALLFVPGGKFLGVALLAFEALTVGIRGFGLVSDETWEKVKNGASHFWEQLKTEAKYAWELFVSEFTEAINVVFNWETWKEIGQYAIDGLIAGLTNVGNKIKEFGKNILDSVKDVLGIASPSKEFKEIGEYSVAGMQKGFDGLYTITDMFGEQLGIMKSYAVSMSDEINVMIDTGLSNYLNALLEAQNNTRNTTAAMTMMFENMSIRSVSAINSIISRLNAIPRNITTTHTIITVEKSGSSSSSTKAYASGGFPDHGQMFIAREAGPELVGTIGGRTAVANNDQIEAGIEQAAYRGFSRAIAEQQGNGTPIVVENKLYLDRKQLRFSLQQADRESGYAVSTGGVLTR